jgi:hypothetical protein
LRPCDQSGRIAHCRNVGCGRLRDHGRDYHGRKAIGAQGIAHIVNNLRLVRSASELAILRERAHHEYGFNKVCDSFHLATSFLGSFIERAESCSIQRILYIVSISSFERSRNIERREASIPTGQSDRRSAIRDPTTTAPPVLTSLDPRSAIRDPTTTAPMDVNTDRRV